MIHASNKRALELCHFDSTKHVYLEGSEGSLSFGETAAFATEIHFYCEPNSEPIEPPGHQQGPAQWHGHQVLLSKFNGCVGGEYRIGLDAQRHVIFQREVSSGDGGSGAVFRAQGPMARKQGAWCGWARARVSAGGEGLGTAAPIGRGELVGAATITPFDWCARCLHGSSRLPT